MGQTVKLPRDRACVITAHVSNVERVYDPFFDAYKEECKAIIMVLDKSHYVLPYIKYTHIFPSQEDAIAWIRREYKIEPDVAIDFSNW